MGIREKVVEPGEQVELSIETVNHRGEGIGRYQGLTVFVPHTVPGETVLTEITELKKSFAMGKAVEIIAVSDQRVEPPCPAFLTCGGSQFQHMSYELQLALKKQTVEETLKRIGKISDVVVHPTLGMAEPWSYRNKAQFQVSIIKGKVSLGFFEEGSHVIVSTAQCLLLDKKINEAAVLVEDLLNKYRVQIYDWKTGKGLLRHVVIRRSTATGQIMVVLVTSKREFADQKLIAKELIKAMPEVVSVIRNVNNSANRQVLSQDNRLLAGQENIIDKVGDLDFKLSPTSFFQVNSTQTEVLYSKALEFADIKSTEMVLDVYCGIGTISLLATKKAMRVFGFEVSTEAIKDAQANALANGIGNVEFVSGKAELWLPELLKQGIKPAVVLVDPPRQGVEKRALMAIADMEPQRIVYISCDPATMARDLALLEERGYKTKEVQPVDMFPQTSHVECVVLITRAYK